MRSRTVLSLEQALSMPSATLRIAQLGWRVIRIEAMTQRRVKKETQCAVLSLPISSLHG